MAEEFAKEIKDELLRPSLKAVPNADPRRRSKQMLEQFAKIKEGLQADLNKATEEHRLIVESIEDLELAIRVLSSAQAMLDAEK